jgi:hypothetical protein
LQAECNTVQEPDIEAAFERLREEHGCVVRAKEVKAMVQGRDRRPELVYKLAIECRSYHTLPIKARADSLPRQEAADLPAEE